MDFFAEVMESLPDRGAHYVTCHTTILIVDLLCCVLLCRQCLATELCQDFGTLDPYLGDLDQAAFLDANKPICIFDPFLLKGLDHLRCGLRSHHDCKRFIDRIHLRLLLCVLS